MKRSEKEVSNSLFSKPLLGNAMTLSCIPRTIKHSVFPSITRAGKNHIIIEGEKKNVVDRSFKITIRILKSCYLDSKSSQRVSALANLKKR